MSSSPVISIRARKRGTTRFLIGSTPENLEGVELLADLAGAEVGGDRGAGDAGDDDRGHERRELADRGEHEEAAEPVEGSEQGEDVGRLQARGAEAEGDGRDQQREPAELEGEEELADELLAVRIRRFHRGDERASSEDHHFPDLFEEGLRRGEGLPYRCGSIHGSSGAGRDPRDPASAESMGWVGASVSRVLRSLRGGPPRRVVCSARFGGDSHNWPVYLLSRNRERALLCSRLAVGARRPAAAAAPRHRRTRRQVRGRGRPSPSSRRAAPRADLAAEDRGPKTTATSAVPALTVTISITGKQGETSRCPSASTTRSPNSPSPTGRSGSSRKATPTSPAPTSAAAAETSSAKTFDFGALKPGKTVEGEWKLSAVKVGDLGARLSGGRRTRAARQSRRRKAERRRAGRSWSRSATQARSRSQRLRRNHRNAAQGRQGEEELPLRTEGAFGG